MSSVCVAGAGSIGCYVGGRLAATGANVQFIGRDRLGAEVAGHGLHLTDYRGAHWHVPPEGVHWNPTVAPAADADLVLVTVKSAATREMAHALAEVIPPHAVIISFQNGIRNAEVLRTVLPNHRVIAGMVPFNVLHRGNGQFHQGTEGVLDVERHAALARYLPLFVRSGLALTQHAQMLSVQWAKLLLNLNNPINALSNMPLKAQLSQRSYRRCLALAQREAMALILRADIRPARLTPLPPHWIPRLLDTPDALFRILGNRMLAMDPLARSSMWDDLQSGRITEVDWINGEVVHLARSFNDHAPVNERLVTLIRDAEQGGRREWSGPALLDELERAAAACRAPGALQHHL
ncbi:2-dehydropantoate 2-reductase [Tahibacter amnicola]|uniref:2-dehydropantoate 2-reductase n=1 Tax=Tahibacter amnicola TaxID=2976241 RepID=A0ABY6BKJ4_9GAMM|nr:2-dehydropantoate 2-reductase [Tahibacter amnicola]UXI70536.1 2-dehydropantoate 2-reductase [Tahibacter amnicola]